MLMDRVRAVQGAVRDMAEGRAAFDPALARDAAALAARLTRLDDAEARAADREEALVAQMTLLAASLTQGSCKGAGGCRPDYFLHLFYGGK